MASPIIKEHPGKTKFASVLLHFVGRALYRLRFDIRIEAPEGINTEGPVLILPKHQNNHDIPLGYMAMMQVLKRHAWSLMKQSLTHPIFLGFFWGIGGIPIDRDNPEQSKHFLLFARKVLYEDNVLVLFPEQTVYPGYMGEGKVAGFRFITGKPEKPLAVNSMGVEFVKGLFRTKVIMRFGPTRWYTRDDDPAEFLHERMLEIAQLSRMEYPYPAPVSRKRRVFNRV